MAYDVTITNGAGSLIIPAGEYDVTAAVTGYDNLTLDPDAFTATTGTGSEDFTIAAAGTLTLMVNETGASGGTPITSGTFIRCSSDGLTTYGTAKTVSATGECEFDHVPYGSVGAGYTFYVLQLTSDDDHSKQAGAITIDMEGSTQTDYVQNLPAALQSFTATDENYAGLPICGTLTFTAS